MADMRERGGVLLDRAQAAVDGAQAAVDRADRQLDHSRVGHGEHGRAG